MKKIISLAPLVFITVAMLAQNATNKPETDKNPATDSVNAVKELESLKTNDDAPLTIVESMPEYPGGTDEMLRFVSKNIVYPEKEKLDGITGTCYVSFVVDKDGSITDVKVLRGVTGGPGLDAEAVRVVKLFPKWKPGMQSGKEVKVQFNLPVKYSLTSGRDKKKKKH